MKKNYSVLLVLLLIFLNGCSENTISQSGDEEDNIKKIKVYASIYPMYDFAKQIGRDKIDLMLMVSPGAEPHDWEPTAKLMTKMENADVFIYNGVDMEMWVDKVIDSLNNKELVVVEASKGIDLLKFEEYGHHNPHEKSHDDYEHKQDDHNHYRGYDPHVWLDPIRAIEQAENIKNAFVEVDEENKDFYEENFNEFANKLRNLNEKFKAELSGRQLNEIVVAHAAFGYITDRYGLEQISISGLTPQEEPSAYKIAEITELINEHKIKYIFYETLTSSKLSEVIAKETGVHIAVLNTIGGVTKEEMKSGKDYLYMMEENLNNLKKALN